MRQYLILGIVAAWLLSLGVAAYFGKDYADGKHAEKALEQKSIVDQVREANLDFADGIATRTTNAIAGIKVEHRTINREVKHEREIHFKVLDNPDCAIPASTVRLLNDARGYKGPGGSGDRAGAAQPAAAVPTPGEAGR